MTLPALEPWLCLPRLMSSFPSSVSDNISLFLELSKDFSGSLTHESTLWFLPKTRKSKVKLGSAGSQPSAFLRSLPASLAPFSLFTLLIGALSPLTGLFSPVSTFLSDTIIKGHAFLEYVYRCSRHSCLQEPSYRSPILDKEPLISVSIPQHGTFALIQSQGTELLTTNHWWQFETPKRSWFVFSTWLSSLTNFFVSSYNWQST